MAANLAFSKVVATPTQLAWSQVYSAGSLFAAISLHTQTPPITEEDGLGTLGKDIISTLESEFFTLENKDLESIKQAITATFARVKESVSSSFVICFLNENILYLYASGGGKAVLKRGEKIGTVLEGEEGSNIKSASGYVQDNDIIVLQTKPFQKIIPSATLASSLDKNTPSEITEDLAPHVHDKSEGGASAIVLSYVEGGISKEEAVGIAAATATSAPTEDEEINEQLSKTIDEPEQDLENTEGIDESSKEINEAVRPIPESSSAPFENPPPKNPQDTAEAAPPFLTDQKPRRRLSAGFGLGGLRKIPRRRRLILLVGTILVILLVVISAMAIANMRSSNNEELFNGIYNEALEKFEEGQSLKDLNESLAQENFRQAQAILIENQNTFPKGSSEDEQIETLLGEVNNELGATDGGTATSSQAQEVDKSESQILSVAIDNPNATYLTQNEDFIYFLDAKGVTRLDKGNSEEEAIIEKDWEEEGGLGAFGSNIYVLDKTDNIFKFVPSGDDFTKSSYITDDDPDLADTAAIAIDGSIYVMDKSGNIQKYTKGAAEQFSITGLEKPMSSPTRIVTAEEFENIYVLDKGNSRIVVLSKTGEFVKAYSADILKNARDIDPQEANNAMFVLSREKVYKINTQ